MDKKVIEQLTWPAIFLFFGIISKNVFFVIVAFIWGLLILKKENIQFNNFFNNINFKKTNFNNINNNMETIDPKQKKKLVSWSILAVLVVLFLAKSIIIIPAGYTGIYHLFGKVKDTAYPSGMHLIFPLAKIEKMSIRTQEYTMSIATAEGSIKGDDSITALTKEGLNVTLDLTVLYHLTQAGAPEVYKNIGLNYEEIIIRPEIRTAIREVVAQYEAKDIYSDKRAEAGVKIVEYLKDEIASRGIEIEDVLLRNVNLPDKLADSIEAKLQAEQESQRFDFVLEKESKEANRKRIEAEGQRDAQKIINQSLTDRYLQYLYIQGLKDREGTIYVPTNPNNGTPLFRNL